MAKLEFQGSYTDKVKAAESVKGDKAKAVIRERKIGKKIHYFVFTEKG